MSEVSNISARVSLNTTEFRKSIKQMNQQLGIAREEFKRATMGLDSIEDASKIAEEKIKMLTNQIELQEKSIEQLNEQQRKAAEQYGENSAQATHYRYQLERARTSLAGMRTDLQRTNEELENANSGMNEATETATNFREKLDNIKEAAKNGALGLAAIAGVAFAKGIQGSDELKKALNGLQTSTGSANKEMNNMKESMLNIYKNNFGEDFADIGNSMAIIKQQTNQTGKELENTTTNALMIKDTFGIEVSESIRSVNQLMKNFGITSDEAYTLIAQGSQNGLNANENFADSINEYSVHFKQLGIDSEGMFNMFKNGAESGVFDIDKLGDSIKEFGIRVKDNSDGTKQAFKDLGLDSKALTIEFNKGGESAKKAFEEVTKKLFEMKDPVKQNETAVALFGTMVEDMGIDSVKALTNMNGSISKNKDTLKEINEIKYNSFMEAVSGIGRQFQVNVLMPIGEKVLPKLNEFANWFQDKMPAIKEFFDKFGNFKTVTNVIIGATTAMLAFTAVTKTMLIIQSVQKAWAAFNVLLTAYRAGTLMATAAQMGFNTAILANPVSLVIAGIIVLIGTIVLLVKNWDTIKPKILDTWESVKNATKIAWEFIKDIFSKIWNFTKETFDKLKGFISKIWDDIKSDIETNVNAIKSVISIVWNGIKAGVLAAVKAIKVVIGTYFNIYKTIITTVFKTIKTVVTTIFDTMKKSVITKFDSMISSIKNYISKGKDVAAKIGKAIVDGLVNAIQNGKKFVKEKVSNLLKSIPDWARDLLGIRSPSRVMAEIGKNIIDGIIVGTNSKEKELNNTISNISDNLKNLFKPGLTSVEKMFDDIKKASMSDLDKLADTIMSARKKQLEEQRDNKINSYEKILATKKSRYEHMHDEKEKKRLKAQYDEAVKSIGKKIQAEKDKYETLISDQVMYQYTTKMLQKENQQDLINLLSKYEPEWQDKGRSFAEKFTDGFVSKSKSMYDSISEVMNSIGDVMNTNTSPIIDKLDKTSNKFTTSINEMVKNSKKWASLDKLESSKVSKLEKEKESKISKIRDSDMNSKDKNSSIKNIENKYDILIKNAGKSQNSVQAQLAKLNKSIAKTLGLTLKNGSWYLPNGQLAYDIKNFATGVQNFRGGLARINEQGGEIVNLPSGSNVIPHDISKQIANAIGGSIRNGDKTKVNVYVTLDSEELVNTVSKVQYSNQKSNSRGLGVLT